jgi:hypothetical protein
MHLQNKKCVQHSPSSGAKVKTVLHTILDEMHDTTNEEGKLLLVLARKDILNSEFRGIHDYILLTHSSEIRSNPEV